MSFVTAQTLVVNLTLHDHSQKDSLSCKYNDTHTHTHVPRTHQSTPTCLRSPSKNCHSVFRVLSLAAFTPLNLPSVTLTLLCHHLFHFPCILSWFLTLDELSSPHWFTALGDISPTKTVTKHHRSSVKVTLNLIYMSKLNVSWLKLWNFSSLVHY